MPMIGNSIAAEIEIFRNLPTSGVGGTMRINEEQQLNPVSDEVQALIAVLRPILRGVLYALKADIVAEAGDYEAVKLKVLPRLYRAGDGDCGICF